MPAYGPNGANGVPFTGFSPTLGGDAIVPVQAGNVQFNGLSQLDDRMSKLLRARGNRGVRRLLQTLIGAAPGLTATETFARTVGQPAFGTPGAYGGVVPIETATTINRATTATDVSNLVSSLTRSSNLVYPTDVSGNGGGSKLASYGVGLLMIGGTIITVGGMGFSI